MVQEGEQGGLCLVSPPVLLSSLSLPVPPPPSPSPDVSLSEALVVVGVVGNVSAYKSEAASGDGGG